MGISKIKMVSVYLFAVSISAAYAHDNRILSRLEKGEVISSKTGSSFFVQALVGQTHEKIQAAFSDLSKLPKIFPQIAFAVPYVGKENGKDAGRNFLYLKLRGLGDGVGVLMEVKSGGGEAFANAKELILSSDYNQSRSTEGEVNINKEANQLELKAQIDAANAKGDESRFVGAEKSLILEGPLNEVMEMPNTRFTIHLGVASYTSIVSAKAIEAAVFDSKAGPAKKSNSLDKKAYLIAKVSVGNQMVRRELGDIRGFGDARLSLAEHLGTNVLSALRVQLEK
jgi:hypothetical protein